MVRMQAEVTDAGLAQLVAPWSTVAKVRQRAADYSAALMDRLEPLAAEIDGLMSPHVRAVLTPYSTACIVARECYP